MTMKYNKTIKTGGGCGSSEMFGVCDISQKPAKHFKFEGPCDPPKILLQVNKLKKATAKLALLSRLKPEEARSVGRF